MNMEKDYKDKVTKAQMALRGAICGDIIGSVYEWHSTKDYDFKLFTRFSRFTDDTVCSIAIADAIISGQPFDKTLQEWCMKYPKAGYGGMFRRWIVSPNPQPYNSFGNGSAMRVSAAGAVATSIEECLELAKQSAEVTHNHPEGIKGAQAVALAIYLAIEGLGKEAIKTELESRFGYDLSRDYDEIKRDYSFKVSCQESVPEAIIAFLGSHDYESSIRRAIALGGDSDTQGAIAGSIAGAYYGKIPEKILKPCMESLPADIVAVINQFDKVLEAKHG